MEASGLHEKHFIMWITGPAMESNWEHDEEGQRTKLKPGWAKAQAEYDRIMGLRGNYLEVSDIPQSSE